MTTTNHVQASTATSTTATATATTATATATSTTAAQGAGPRPIAALDRLRTRREARLAYKRAERELAAYTTEADLQELCAILERSDGRSDIYTRIIESKLLSAA